MGRVHKEERAVMAAKGEEWETNRRGEMRMEQHLEESWEESLEQSQVVKGDFENWNYKKWLVTL